MQAQFLRALRHVYALAFTVVALFAAGAIHAAPFAAFVMDARNGEVIFARNHDTRLHPASLTKMMTLYVAFEAVKHGEVSLDTQFTVSQRAAGTACVCLGLRPGQRISLRYLLRAAALRSANDASVVIAEGISGSVEAFAERMTRTARAMGMQNTTFRNPHGLTQTGHVSTARDMSILGRQLYFDYPQYFNMFSRRSDNAGVAVVPNTNRRFLDAYSGADGIKTGYTRAAGFNLTASAQRGGKHIITTMFGGTSAAQRNARVAELMDIGFSRAATRVATRAPRTPAYQGRGGTAVAEARPSSGASSSGTPARGDDDASAAAKTIRLQMAVRRSPRPEPRPLQGPPEELLVAVLESVETAVTETVAEQAALESLPVTPPAREDVARAEPVPDPEPEAAPSVESQIAEALDAGFALAQIDERDSIPDQSAPDEMRAASEPDRPAEAESAPVPQTITEVVRLLPKPRPESLNVPVSVAAVASQDTADLAQNSEPEPEHAPEPAATSAAPDSVIAELQGPSDDAVWIGANDTITGALAAQDADHEDVAHDAQSRTALNADLDAMPQEKREAVEPERPSGIILTSATQTLPEPGPPSDDRRAIATIMEDHLSEAPRVVTRVSTSDGGRLWGVSLGQFNSRAAAERGVIAVKMAEAASLANGVSRIRQTSGRFEASFAGLTQAEAERACLRLSARAMDCAIAHP